jgi:hypothetical protein
MLELKPDFDHSYQRIEAFWHNQVLDRPVTMFTLYKPASEQAPLPVSLHSSNADRWLDVEYQAELALASLQNQVFLGDTLPIAFPNLGPEVFSSFFGCPIHFSDVGTSWTDPILEDWQDADDLHCDWDNPYLKKLEEMTEALLEIGRGKFLTGMTDWHPGGDALAAFRDPQRLAMDLLDNLEAVKRLLERIEADYFAVYDHFYNILRQSGQPITSWTPLMYEGKYYIPSNDFSIMISKQLFDDIFLPGIQRECQFLDRSIYHLDGPGALRHLDSLLGISELHAVQWVPGAGNEAFARWIQVYQKIQAAGKGIQVNCRAEEISQVMEYLQPEGLFLWISGVPDEENGTALLNRLMEWTKAKRKK